MENKAQTREQFIFKINDHQIDVLPLLRLILNEGDQTIVSAIDTLIFDYIGHNHDAEPEYLPNLFSVLKEVRDAFQRVGKGTEFNFYVVNDTPEEVESKLYWSIIQDYENGNL